MIDIRLVREQPEAVTAALGRRGVPADAIERLIECDSQARAASGRRDELRSQIKDLSRQVQDARRQSDDRRAEELASAEPRAR